MEFRLPQYIEPDFNESRFRKAPDARLGVVTKRGVAPTGYHATTIFPEYFKLNGEWMLITHNSMDCVITVSDSLFLESKEFRKLVPGDNVVLGRTEDGSEGVYVHTSGFMQEASVEEKFAFRTSRSRETSYSRDYDRLYDLLRYEREHGYIVWVLGPAAVFDYDSRKAMEFLIENGYAHAVMGGNALATHDLEAAVFKTALGQDIYTQRSMPNGHYNHLDILNKARSCRSLEEYVASENISDGIIHACIKNDVPFVLAGSIRDDGPLPEVIHDVYESQDAMRYHTSKATTILGLATQLHSIATGNLTPVYHFAGEKIRPIFVYNVDVSEFAVNKLRDRGTLEITSIVTNIQDFLANLHRNLSLSVPHAKVKVHKLLQKTPQV